MPDRFRSRGKCLRSCCVVGTTPSPDDSESTHDTGYALGLSMDPGRPTRTSPCPNLLAISRSSSPLPPSTRFGAPWEPRSCLTLTFLGLKVGIPGGTGMSRSCETRLAWLSLRGPDGDGSKTGQFAVPSVHLPTH